MIFKFKAFTYFQERNRAAKELFHIVSSDLREVPAEELSAILDQLTKQMLDNVKVINENHGVSMDIIYCRGYLILSRGMFLYNNILILGRHSRKTRWNSLYSCTY